MDVVMDRMTERKETSMWNKTLTYNITTIKWEIIRLHLHWKCMNHEWCWKHLTRLGNAIMLVRHFCAAFKLIWQLNVQLGSTGIRRLMRRLATVPPRCNQEPLWFKTRMEDPKKTFCWSLLLYLWWCTVGSLLGVTDPWNVNFCLSWLTLGFSRMFLLYAIVFY